VTYSALLPVELADSALEQMRSFSQQPQSFQVSDDNLVRVFFEKSMMIHQLSEASIDHLFIIY
jgi:hypothetical protein